MRPRKCARTSVRKVSTGSVPAEFAQLPEPAIADFHMADLVAVDGVDDIRAGRVAGGAQPRDRCGRDVETAGLQNLRNDRQPRRQIVGGIHRRLPQPVVRRQVAIGRAEFRQPVGEKAKCRASSSPTDIQSAVNWRGIVAPKRAAASQARSMALSSICARACRRAMRDRSDPARPRRGICEAGSKLAAVSGRPGRSGSGLVEEEGEFARPPRAGHAAAGGSLGARIRRQSTCRAAPATVCGPQVQLRQPSACAASSTFST